MPAVDYERLRYIQLKGDNSKLPQYEWGGYSQDFDAAERVREHNEVQMLPADEWGIVDIEDPPHNRMALLIFDLDIHKAPAGFDADRVGVPTDTLVTRSQNGGFHVYFAVNGCARGALNESDFQMTADPGWDIDIRGSSVSMHVVAPGEIPGVDTPYEIVNDERIAGVFQPAEAAERITLDGEPLLEFNPGDTGVDYDFDVPTEAPDELPTCYHAGLELRKAAPDDHPNTHKVNMLTAACGLAAGFDAETVAGHFCGQWSPYDGMQDVSDKETTEYQVGQIERTGYNPPAESTLRDYGILDEGEHCDADCPIDYHGPPDDSSPTLDIAAERARPAAEAAAVAGAQAETDGGSAATQADSGAVRSFEERVRVAITEADNEQIQAKTARHRIALAFVQEFDFVYPEEGVQGWRSTLYVFDPDSGIYEPRGEDLVEHKLERVAGDFATNHTTREVVGKVERLSITDDELDTDPERLVVGNGILDLHTGELEPFTPEEYHTTKIDVDWKPEAGDPEAIDGFLHDIVEEHNVPTLYRLIAHTLYGEYIAEKAAILIGSGSNGKSMFLSLIEEFLGSWNIARRELHDFGEDSYALNNLQGRLANLATEIGERELRDTTAFKKATGRDRIDAQVKHEKPVSFENYATLIFATNAMPVFSQDNHAIWRRWLYVDFPYTFDAGDPEAKDPEPERVLKRRLFTDEEFEALLVRCQQEIQRWYAGEPLFSDAMEPDEVRDKMKRAAEPVYAFASVCLESADPDDDFERTGHVRAAYNQFADEEDLPRLSKKQFGERLLALRDYNIESTQRRVDGGRPRVYQGIRLSPLGRQLAGLDEPGDDEQTQASDVTDTRKRVLDQLHEMVDETGGAVGRSAVAWACTDDDLPKGQADHTIDRLIEAGEIVEVGDGLVPA
jgi:P4 family phage/plasmid primase-like protien